MGKYRYILKKIVNIHQIDVNKTWDIYEDRGRKDMKSTYIDQIKSQAVVQDNRGDEVDCFCHAYQQLVLRSSHVETARADRNILNGLRPISRPGGSTSAASRATTS